MLLVAIEVIRTCCSHGDASFRGILLGLNGSAAVPFKPPQLLTYRRAEKRASVQMKPRLHCAASEQQGVAENKTESWGQRGKGRSSYTRWWMRHLVSPAIIARRSFSSPPPSSLNFVIQQLFTSLLLFLIFSFQNHRLKPGAVNGGLTINGVFAAATAGSLRDNDVVNLIVAKEENFKNHFSLSINNETMSSFMMLISDSALSLM